MKKLITLLLLLSGASFGERIITDKGDDFAIILPRTATSAQLTAETAARVAGDATKVDKDGGSASNLTVVGKQTLTNTTSTAWSVGYWTNSITGVGTNGVYVRKVYTPAGTTNTYYSLYQ